MIMIINAPTLWRRGIIILAEMKYWLLYVSALSDLAERSLAERSHYFVCSRTHNTPAGLAVISPRRQHLTG